MNEDQENWKKLYYELLAMHRDLEKELAERPTRKWEHSLQMTIRERGERIEALERELAALKGGLNAGVQPSREPEAHNHPPEEEAEAGKSRCKICIEERIG